MENRESSYYSVSYGLTALQLCHDTEHEKVREQYIWQKSSKFNSFAVISDLLNGGHQSSYYSVSYGLTAHKICHYTVHKKVAKQYIWEKSFKFNSFAVISDLLNGEPSK